MNGDRPIIEVIKELPKDIHAAQHLLDTGWDGAGWYFWEYDELGAICHGPFESKEQASAAMDEYEKTA